MQYGLPMGWYVDLGMCVCHVLFLCPFAQSCFHLGPLCQHSLMGLALCPPIHAASSSRSMLLGEIVPCVRPSAPLFNVEIKPLKINHSHEFRAGVCAQSCQTSLFNIEEGVRRGVEGSRITFKHSVADPQNMSVRALGCETPK